MVELKMPQLGESVAEGTVTQWHVKAGDRVRREQPLLEVATDKADTEVPSPCDGVVTSLSAKEGDIVPTGGLLCTIDASAPAAIEASVSASAVIDADARASAVIDADARSEAFRVAPAAEPGRSTSVAEGRTMSAPSTRKLARAEGVDLAALPGTGERGRITRDDVLRAATIAGSPISERPSFSLIAAPPSMPAPPPSMFGGFGDEPQPAPSRAPQAPSRATPATTELARMLETPTPGVGLRSYRVPAYEPRPGDEVVPFSRRRRITADHMVYSQAVSPHVVTVAELDMQKVTRAREQHKDAFEREGFPLTFLAFVLAATVKGLREYPNLNARVLADSYVKLKEINVGIAVDTPTGLVVANVKNADQLSMRGIAKNIDELAKRARNGKITADDLRGTTFTVSNPGRKGNLFGGAIISQPNVAILRIGEIKKRAVVITENGEDRIAIHPMMYAALSYDHRIIDGVEANAYLWRVADVLSRAELDIG
ncbi:MAG: 2-oxo acid dehydrogenase subunit E2 [Myxococcales bacterium]|nr:2-oxo acid dehydrogenase subunit E2 [Myxococcales bacterium]